MANVTSIPSDFPGMSKDNLDQYIVDFLNAIYGEEVRDKFARISYLLGHQVPDSVEDAATAASISAEAAMNHATAAKKSEVAAQQYMTTASEHVVKAGEYRTEAADSASESQTNADQAYNWNQNCLTLYHQTQNLTNQVESYVEQILGVGYHVKIVTEDEYENLDTGFDPNTLYIVLESTYNPLDSLVSYYPLTSDLTDYLNNAKVGQAIGCLGFGDWDHSGSSFYMKRTDSIPTATKRENYISLPNDFLEGINFSNGATFVIRCKPDKAVSAGNGDWTRIFNFYKHASSAPNDGEGEVYLTQGLIGTWYYNAQSVQYLDTSVAGILTANQWHKVALVIEPIKPDNTHVKVSVFVDYRTIGSTQGVFAGTGWLNKVDQNWIGASRFDDDDFTGMVKDFRVYNKALSDSELINVMASNFKWRLRWSGGQDESFSDLDKKIQDILDGTTPLPYLSTSGGVMTGDVDMDSHAITGLPNPAEDTAAIPKGWADGQYTPITAAIRPTVTGNPIHVEDSAEAPVQGLCVYGKTEQATTTGAQLLPAEVGQTAISEDEEVSLLVQSDGISITIKENASTYTSASDVYLAGSTTNNDVSGYDSLPQLPAGTYTVQNTGTFSTLFIVVWRNGGSVMLGNVDNGITKTFDVEDNDKFRIFFRPLQSGTVTEKVQATITAGSTALPWEPYTGGKPSPSPDYPQELVSAGDDGQIDVTVCGKNLVGDGNLIKYGYISNTDGSISSMPAEILYSPFIPAKGMSKIVFSIPAYNSEDSNAFGLRLGLYKNGEWIKNILNIANFLGQPVDLEGADNIRISVPESFLENFQVEFSETATAYEHYTGKTITFTGDLPGIPVDSGGNYTDPDGQQWVCNYRDWARGVDVQSIKKYIVNQDTSFSIHLKNPDDVTKNRIQIDNITDAKPAPTAGEKGAIMATCFPTKSANDTYRFKTRISLERIGSVASFYYDGIQSVEAAVAFFGSTPMEVIYQLATPIETPIPAEELAAYKALQTYDGTTNVTATDGAGISLRYIADTQKYIDNKIAALSAAMLEG